MTPDREFLARLDAAVGCLQCGDPLGDSPSDDFCDAICQQRWHAARSERLVGYRDPWHDEGPDRLPGIGTNAMNTGGPDNGIRDPFRGPLYPCTVPGCGRSAALGVPHCSMHVETTPDFRLRRQTGNLPWDWGELGQAWIAARSAEQLAACRLRHQQLLERQQRADRRTAWIRPRSFGRRAEWAAMVAEAHVASMVQNPQTIMRIVGGGVS